MLNNFVINSILLKYSSVLNKWGSYSGAKSIFFLKILVQKITANILQPIFTYFISHSFVFFVHCVKYARMRFSLTRIFPFPYHIETSSLTFSANQRAGFYMIRERKNIGQRKPVFWRILRSNTANRTVLCIIKWSEISRILSSCNNCITFFQNGMKILFKSAKVDSCVDRLLIRSPRFDQLLIRSPCVE